MPDDVVQECSDEPMAEGNYLGYRPAGMLAPAPAAEAQLAIYREESEKRMEWEREQMASANKRQSRATALQLAMQLAGPLNGDHQAIVRAAREFCAFIEE